jgi:predicted nucleotidyltransferase
MQQAVIKPAEILARLKAHEIALREHGVLHAALFGSRARGEARLDSDIDILIEIDPEARLGVFDYVGLKDMIAGYFDVQVDVVSRDGLKPYLISSATADAIYAF